ncbi:MULTISPECIES: di-heme-cytochrome C peroxidase [unclassified Bradyrhizobium]|uniref:di-heme-cytochrome C peroxidase n=1 Tax=unclassified Bradyrhizobium TaxID=2631580 RepID=UPI0020B3B9F6|nr:MULTISPECIES: di-heme-cytochrome C peroxidase [unclassified Bradyrhizobium]MCP3399099.1 di-heme-cytochrome C peroxidase [Bradyrhizobium sp. CCGB20]MCP3407747.1 di-heme-cytochrome C peroxidase [Bradyrhizobium sp. CCGB01]
MRRVAFLIRVALVVAASSGIETALADPIYVDQGQNWKPEDRADYYTRDQGSRLINLTWLRALKTKDGQPFLSDGLTRYGFLPNPDNKANLPVGLHTTGPAESQMVGITCSACHTRQVEVGGKTYRIDGGPAFVDFQEFLSDLDKAVGDVTASEPAFAEFAAAVSEPAADVAKLRQRVDAWHRRFHAFVAGTLPPVGWGPGRLDAVGIIFNRISGTDIGPPPDLLIKENMRIADAPVRYPFLWNSPMQNQTDWAGFVLNGNRVFALARNTGQALAFANFEPKPSSGLFLDYSNSINFDGLERLEKLVLKMGPPKWPQEWDLDQKLADEGQKLYQRHCSDGCHEKQEIRVLRDLFATTWETPLQNVGTDTRQFDELGWRVKTGALKGAGTPGVARDLEEEDYAVHMMFSAVAGTILNYKLSRGSELGAGDGFGSLPRNGQVAPAAPKSPLASPAPARASIAPASAQPSRPPDSLTIEPWTFFKRTLKRGEYEARVLEGIWAAAPYLHNGSVPTLAELLVPPAKRMSQFKVGARYDTKNVGLDVTQEGPTRPATDCDHLNSGNSRCGHDYGTRLSDDEKKALLEYLKTL